jgi:hypothetical protein
MDNAPAAMALTAIQSLQNHLTHLATSGHQANPDGALLQQQFLVAQQQFQGDVLPSLTDPAVPQTVQPILTEMNRTLRLLAMDVAFMQTSRNAQTTQQQAATTEPQDRPTVELLRSATSGCSDCRRCLGMGKPDSKASVLGDCITSNEGIMATS